MTLKTKSDFQTFNPRQAQNEKSVNFRHYIVNSDRDIFLDDKGRS